MNLATDLVALAVRHLSDKKIIAKPDAWSELIGTITTGKTYDQRIATDVVLTAGKLTELAKKTNINRKFKKITANV